MIGCDLSSSFQKILLMDAFLVCASVYFFTISFTMLLLGKFGFEHHTLSVWESSIEQTHNGCEFEGNIYERCYYLNLKLHDPLHHDSNHCTVVYPNETPHQNQVQEWFLQLQPGNETSQFLRLWNEPSGRMCYTPKYVENLEITGWIFLSIALTYLSLGVLTFCLSLCLKKEKSCHPISEMEMSVDIVEYVVDSNESIV